MLSTVAKIKLVKPEKVAAIENSLIAAAQQGKLRGKISEEELIAMLGSQSSNDNKIIVRGGICSLSGGVLMMNGEHAS
jgi:DNA-binding TFAR19-related protein (PDSD5 family)